MNKFFIKRGNTKNNSIKLDKLIESAYNKCQYNAKKRGHEFSLSRNAYNHVIHKNCIYCGSPPRQYSDKIIRNGIDRVDSNIGYVFDNVISCCSVCNSMKGKLSFKEFVEKSESIYKNTTFWNNIRNKYGVDSFEFKALMFKYGRVIPPNELMDLLQRKLIKKSEVLCDFKTLLYEYPEEFDIFKKQLKDTIGTFAAKKLTRIEYYKNQIKEWDTYK